MMAFAGMLIGAATGAGMKVPPDAEDYDSNEYPHFHVFCLLQLGRRMEPGEHWENAEIIARVSEEEIRTMTLGDFIDRGLIWST